MKRFCTLLLALLIALSLSSCALLPETEVRRTAPIVKQTLAQEFQYAYCTRGDIELTRRVSVTYVPIQKVSVYFETAGEQIDEIFVKAGDAVKKGDLLGQLKLDGVNESIESCQRQIDSVTLQLRQLEENRALALKKQAVQYAADKKALEEAVESVNETYDSRSQSLNDNLDVLTLRLKTLEENRAKRQLIAPMDGTVTYARSFSESSLSSLSERAVTIADSTMSLFTATTDVWESLPEGTEVIITVKKIEYEAVVTSASALGLAEEERVPGQKAVVYLTLKHPAPDLEDNDKGSFTILLDERRDVLCLSEKAISRAGEQNIVYYETDEGIKSYKPVTLGLSAGGIVEILSGLDEGEQVIIS